MDEIKARQAAYDLANAGKPVTYLEKPYRTVDRTKLRQNPDSPVTSKALTGRDALFEKAAQSASVNFLGGNLADALAFPPDSMGTIGPAQFIMAINGRIRSFDKVSGAADGVLDVTPDAFFAPAMIPIAGPIITNRTSDPRIRYDRLSRRWILIAIDIPNGAGAVENRIVMAVSDSNSISAATTWTFLLHSGQPGRRLHRLPDAGHRRQRALHRRQHLHHRRRHSAIPKPGSCASRRSWARARSSARRSPA